MTDMKLWKHSAQLGAALGIILGPAIIAWAIERPATPPVAPAPVPAPAPVAPSNTRAAWSDAFANVAASVRPTVVFIRADTKRATTASRDRGDSGNDPFRDFFRQWQR